ncbi:MAG: bifunctional oligoribonuclease/PAP phosphatase NrnA [Bacteroidia bacterium]
MFSPLNNIFEIKPLLAASPRPQIVITTHHKPDADALGSALGLWNFFKQININSSVITPTDYGDFLLWMPGEKEVIDFEKHQKQSAELVANADLIFCLDFNSLKRINKLGELVAASKAKKVMIDHHLEPENFAIYGLWTLNASSTCELVYLFIEQLGEVEKINKEVASCLYAGIMTDTASFKHPSTYPSTHRVAAVLLEKGAESNSIYENIYDNFSENRTRFIGYCLNEKLRILPELHTALMSVTAEELKRYHIVTGDTEGLVNFGLTIQGIRLSVLIIDRTHLRKLSFRSKGKFPCNEVARLYFSGGGHFNAAGGETKDPLENVESRVKSVLKEYQHLLI